MNAQTVAHVIIESAMLLLLAPIAYFVALELIDDMHAERNAKRNAECNPHTNEHTN